ncbi:MAG: hypothetical protein IJC18_04690 [Clostridia bacterium]|nr:hypothetical protein [Clostridia bacterium]MBQ9994224.1 hypothetical protein [Clostridia bacterium]
MALRYNERDQMLADSRELFADALVSNKLLISAAGVNLIAGACISLTNACILAVMMAALLPLVGYLSVSESSRLSRDSRPALYCAITTGVVFALSLLFDLILPYGISEMGIFAPLVAFDSLVLYRIADDAPILTRREAAYEGLSCAIVFAAIAIPVAFVREIIGGGSFFGAYLGFSGVSSLQMPFAGFILCGIAIAVYRAIAAKRAEGRDGR